VAIKKADPESVSPATLKKIWSTITPADWLALVQEYKPDHQWNLAGSTIKGLCIYHADTTPSFIINLEKGFAHCYGGTCQKHEWNPVQFFAKLSDSGYGSALRVLKTRFGIKLPPSYFNNIQKIEDNNDVKRILCQALNAELVDALQHSDKPEYEYAEKSGFLSWFRKRGFPEDAAHMWPVGIIPPREKLNARLDQHKDWSDKKDKAIEYLKQYVSLPGVPNIHEGSVVFFYYTSPTTIGRLRIRRPNTNEYYAVEDPYEKTVGLFGLNMFSHILGDLSKRALYVVEGELDALSLISHQLSAGLDNVCVVGTGGTMESNLDQLAQFGFENAWLVQDNDAAGTGWARELMSENDKVTRVFRWKADDATRHIKDVDEAIRAHGFESFYRRLCDEDNFPRNHEWVSEQLESDLAIIDKDDLDGRLEKAAEWGKCIRSDAQKTKYVSSAVQFYGFDKKLLLQEMQGDEEESRFVGRLAHQLAEREYHFMQQREVGNGKQTIVSAWSRRKKVIRNLPISSISSTRAAIEADLGRLDEYIKEELGEPPFLTHRLNNQGQPMALPFTQKMQMIGQYFLQAVVSAIPDSRPESMMKKLGQGFHYVPDFEDEKPAVILVNGIKCYKGTFTEDGNDVKYEELDGPLSGDYTFRLCNSPWSKSLRSVKDIEAGAKVNPKEVFEKLFEVLMTGWRFQNQELDAQFLAADVLYTPIAAAFEHMVVINVQGETHSGKSTLMQVIGGDVYRDVRLCESCKYLDDYTAAGVRQLLAGDSLRLFLDEFEDENVTSGARINRRSMSVRDILQMIRTISGGGSGVRGTPDGEAKESRLYFPITIGGVHTVQETVDVNRFVHISTKHIEGFGDAVGYIRSKFSTEELVQLRRDVTTCLLTRIPELIQTQKDVIQEFANNSKLPTGSLERQNKNFYPAAALMKMMGLDYRKFLVDICTTKLETLRERGGTKRDSEVLWDNVLHTQINLKHVGVEDVGGLASLAKLLSEPATRHIFNETDLGVYLVEGKNWLIVFWHKAVPGVLRNAAEFRYTAHPGRLKLIADQDKRVVPREKLKRSSFLKKEVWPRVGARISYEDFSVIDLNDTIQYDSKSSSEDLESDEADRDRLMEDIPGSVADAKVSRGEFEI